jgi:hypothetical protein
MTNWLTYLSDRWIWVDMNTMSFFVLIWLQTLSYFSISNSLRLFEIIYNVHPLQYVFRRPRRSRFWEIRVNRGTRTHGFHLPHHRIINKAGYNNYIARTSRPDQGDSKHKGKMETDKNEMEHVHRGKRSWGRVTWYYQWQVLRWS